MNEAKAELSGKVMNATVIVTGLGYFVDMFDFFLYNMVRTPSLKDLGLSGTALTDAGLLVSNFQMAGILLGSFLWGILGDRFGRKRSLFASIIVYSAASLGCGFVQDVDTYAVLRFVAGVGISGELGAGVTLIAERMKAEGSRGIGVTLFISMGFIGVLAAVLVVELVDWRTAYIIGGVAGFVLLIARTLIDESSLYTAAALQSIRRGNLAVLLKKGNLHKYLAAIFIIAPGVFAPQIIWTLSPELSHAFGVEETVKANIVLGVGFTCVLFADLIAIWLSEKFRSRRKAIKVMLSAAMTGFVIYLTVPFLFKLSYPLFLVLNGLMGLTMGLWIMGIIAAAEQFGTDIRATVATTVPSFSRALTIPMNLAFASLKGIDPIFAVAAIGAVIFMLSFWGWRMIRETYGKDLNYVES